MPRTLVKSGDLCAAIVTALNGLSLNGGTLSAVAQPGNHAVTVKAHADAPLASYNYTWSLELK